MNDVETEVSVVEVEQEETLTNEPNYNQLGYTFQMLTRNELLRANQKYGAEYYYSSNEALGTLTAEFFEVTDELRNIHIVAGSALDEESMERLPKLLIELVQLSAVCQKTALSLCDMRGEAEQISKLMQEAQVVAQKLEDLKNTEVEG